jgi:hypothetical protein
MAKAYENSDYSKIQKRLAVSPNSIKSNDKKTEEKPINLIKIGLGIIL